ncbi:MAG: succinate dehydrogenase assembly factor 2 [Pseudomonadota bacterium]|nr:succinate dehydrogenase assembly factor 2 [Pseudomonadota bacterium]
MKELDVLLTRYLEESYRGATPAEQQAFRRLLDAQDPLLYAYCLGRASPSDAMLASVLERITAGAVNHR